MTPDGVGIFRVGGVRREDRLKIWIIIDKGCPWNVMKF